MPLDELLAPPAVDAAACLRAVYGVAPAFHELGAGQWSRAYAFRHDNRDLVLRISAHADDFARDMRVARWRSAGLPVPEVLKTGAWKDGYYAISERCEGEFLDHLDAAGWRATLPSFITTLAALRRADLSETTGYGDWDANGNGAARDWTSYLLAVAVDAPPSRTFGWSQRLVNFPGATEAFDDAIAGMEALLPYAGTRRHLVHADMMNRNVFVSNGRISGLIDWGCSLIGDPVYEVAGFTFWQPWFAALDGIDIANVVRAEMESTGDDTTNFAERLRCYELHIAAAHIAYHAHLGDASALAGVVSRLRTLAVSRAVVNR